MAFTKTEQPLPPKTQKQKLTKEPVAATNGRQLIKQCTNNTQTARKPHTAASDSSDKQQAICSNMLLAVTQQQSRL
jgi:hypothetical protein